MKRLLLSAAIVAIAGPAFGQAFELPTEDNEDVIAIGQRIEPTTLSELTSAASIITETEIEARNPFFVNDILRSLPGVSVNNSGPSSNLSQIRVRGNEANQVLVLIDGVEVNNPLTGEFDFGGLQAGNIARVEFLRGEQSALWGADAIGGVISIITRSGEAEESFNASFEAGTHNTVQGQLAAVIPVGTAALTINGTAFSSDNFDISDNDGEDDSSDSQSLNIGLNNIKIGGVTLGAKAGFSELNSSFEAQVNGVLQDTLDDTSNRDTESYRVNAAFESFGFDHLVTASLNRETNNSVFTAVDFSFVTFVEEILVDPITGANLTSSLNTVGERQNLNWTAKKNWGPHQLTVLAEAERSDFEQEAIDENDIITQLEDDIDNQSLAADYTYNANALLFNASARQDFNNLFDNAFTWKVGLGYDLENFGLGQLRASVGTGVKNPTLTELFGVLSTNTFVGNPDLLPEESFGFNVGYTHNFWDDALSVSVDYFNSELENEIFTEFNGFNIPPAPDRASNRELESSREGIEVEVNAKIDDTFTFQGSATFLNAEFINSFPVEIREATRRPDFIASATATWALTDKLDFTINVDHTGEQLDTDFGTFQTVTLDNFTLIGASARYSFNDHLAFTFRGTNIGDESFEEVVGFASAGRAVFAGLELDF